MNTHHFESAKSLRQFTLVAGVLAGIFASFGNVHEAFAFLKGDIPARTADEAPDLSGDWQFQQVWQLGGALDGINGTTKIKRRTDGDYDFLYRWVKNGTDSNSAWHGSVREGVLWGVNFDKPEAAFALAQASTKGCFIGVLFNSVRGSPVSGISLCRAPARIDISQFGGWDSRLSLQMFSLLVKWVWPEPQSAFSRVLQAWRTANGAEPPIPEQAPLAIGRIQVKPVSDAPTSVPARDSSDVEVLRIARSIFNVCFGGDPSGVTALMPPYDVWKKCRRTSDVITVDEWRRDVKYIQRKVLECPEDAGRRGYTLAQFENISINQSLPVFSVSFLGRDGRRPAYHIFIVQDEGKYYLYTRPDLD